MAIFHGFYCNQFVLSYPFNKTHKMAINRLEKHKGKKKTHNLSDISQLSKILWETSDLHKGLYPRWWWHHLISNVGRRNTGMDCRTSPTRQQTNAPKFIKRKTCCIYTLSSLKSQSDPSRWHFCNPFQLTLRLNAFEMIEHFYILKNSSFSLASAEASLYRREAGEKEKESARETMGRGKRRSELFPSSHCSPRAFYFSIIAISLGYPAGASAEKRGSFSLAKTLNFVFKAHFRRRTFHEPSLIRIKADPNKNNNNFILCRHKELRKASRAGASQVHE